MHILAAMLLTALAVQAQQAIFEKHDTRSPQFNDDGTVTLRIKAPEAQKVTVIGDCIKDGRQTCFYEVNVVDELGTEIARVTVEGYKIIGK